MRSTIAIKTENVMIPFGVNTKKPQDRKAESLFDTCVRTLKVLLQWLVYTKSYRRNLWVK